MTPLLTILLIVLFIRHFNREYIPIRLGGKDYFFTKKVCTAYNTTTKEFEPILEVRIYKSFITYILAAKPLVFLLLPDFAEELIRMRYNDGSLKLVF